MSNDLHCSFVLFSSLINSQKMNQEGYVDLVIHYFRMIKRIVNKKKFGNPALRSIKMGIFKMQMRTRTMVSKELAQNKRNNIVINVIMIFFLLAVAVFFFVLLLLYFNSITWMYVRVIFCCCCLLSSLILF